MRLNRRQFIKSAVFAGTASACGLGFEKVFSVESPPAFTSALGDSYGSQAPEAKVDPATGKIDPNPDVLVRHSVCLGCYSDCGNRIKISRKTGRIMRAMGNAYHPMASEPHLSYQTPVIDSYKPFSLGHDGLGHNHGTLCARGNSTVQAPYDPFRILVPLKRAGARGAGKWKPVDWDTLVNETVEGGQLFQDIGENRFVEGLRQVRDIVTPLDPQNPAYGPKANQLVFFGGRFDGRFPFCQRMIMNSFGSANYYGHTGT
ncbi:MAG: hypothetical protein P4N59_18455 [Negativicutes bacterium]|nr:hypothetical protein [Negativicutes bacterium]